MGESGDSESNYGLDAFGKKNAIYPNESRGDLEVASQIVRTGFILGYSGSLFF